MSPVVSAPPKVSCVRCNKNHDTPAAFLMACCKCERAWHHTCHIPPVTEKEIMGRIDADERGKRDAGLSAWQCRRCTKKIRVEAPATAPARPVESAQKTSAPCEPRGKGGDTNGVAAPVARNASVPVDSKSSGHSSSTQARKSAEPAVIEVDDDIQMVDAAPPPIPVKQSTPVVTKVPVSIPAQPVVQEIPPSVNSVSRPPPEKPRAPAHPVGQQNRPTSGATIQRGQKRKAKDAFVITPLPRPQVAAKATQAGPSRPRSPAPPVSPRPDVQPVAAPQRKEPSLMPPPPPPPPQPAQPSSVSIKDIRALISDMRAAGQLKPPPTVDYVLHQPTTAQKRATRQDPSASAKAALDLRSQTRDLEDVERKLEDFSMDIDPLPPEPEPDPDPHNIDDLYGDVAPQFRVERPPSAPRAKSAAPAQNRLLFVLQKKRHPEQNDSSADAKPRTQSSEGARKPRKAPAHRLKGKALQKKQAAGLYFDVGEVDWRTRGT
ncbi:hypothetical protein OH77DRAFT_1588304 [Trametes cingulata]|nr:hypothetical protein OH77DRAFT_1588304 [Trametes cingulata]